jgi:protein-tyrosine phosphatase
MVVRVCFVCLGNICRSPTAEGIFRHLVESAGLADRIQVESAGTGAWQVGNAPDARSRAEALRRGIVLDGRARRFRTEDFDRFDHVVALDRFNLADLRQLARDDEDTAKLTLLRDHDGSSGLDVPDPYLGDEEGFPRVFDICEQACRGLLVDLRGRHGL